MNLRKNPYTSSEVLDDEVCIFNPNNAQYITLNSTASRIWDLLDLQINIKEIVEILKKEYTEKEIKLEDETRSFIEDCIETGILIYEK